MIQHKLTVAAAFCALLAFPALLSADCLNSVWTTHHTQQPSGWDLLLQTVDYDGDGKLDLVGAMASGSNGGENTLYSWHGVGDGRFETPVSLGNINLADLTVADVNHDGRDDLIMSKWQGAHIVRLGNGSGFDPDIYTGIGAVEYQIAAVYFDGDSNIDLLTTSSGNNFIIYHGQGNGNFTEIRRGSTGGPNSLPYGIVAADFDGDGRKDIAYSADKRIQVRFQNADGTFTAPLVLSDVDVSRELVTGDFDEDGKPDLATATYIAAGPGDTPLIVYRNLGSRTFGQSLILPRLPHIGNLEQLRVRDVNGDGHLDLVTRSPGLILTYIGKGDGTFRSPSYYTPSSRPYVLTLGDFDGDGDLDLAAGGNQTLYIARSTCGPAVHLYSASEMITVGDTAPLRALVSGIASSTPTPRGTVTFREGATILGSAPVDDGGVALIEAGGLTAGNHTVTADFGGNSEEGSATSQNIIQKVTTNYTTTKILLPAGGSVYGSPDPFTIEVKDQYGSGIYGYCTLNVDGVTTEQYVYQGTFEVTLNLNPGPHTMAAFYQGDFYTPRSNSGPKTFNTAKADPHFTVSGELTVRSGQSHSLQFTAPGSAGAGTPTGTVQVREGSTVLGTLTLSGGTLTLPLTLARGGHEVVITYSGDAFFASKVVNLTLSVLPNVPLAIDARGMQSGMVIRAVLPPGTISSTLYRRVAGSPTWTQVPAWTPASDVDPGPLTRGVLYDYHVEAMVDDALQSSNVDSAILFNDDLLAAGTRVKRLHFDELRLSINALRASAGLAPFNFDGTYAQTTVRGSHLLSMRNALAEARAALGMTAPSFTDAVPAGAVIKMVHIQELRDQAR